MSEQDDPTVLVAGATGRLGRHVVRELQRRGCRVRALVRSPERLRALGLEPEETVVGDLTDRASLAGCCDGVQVVFSCAGAAMNLGGLRERTSFGAVDDLGNRALLDEAIGSGVPRFVYVSLAGADRLLHTEYAAAHERFVRALAGSGISTAVVRPTAYFSFLDELVQMARKGRGIVIGSGEPRTNPIHEADVAAACADAVLADANGPQEVEVGGPETFTRRGLVEAAFTALHRQPRVHFLPPWLFRGLAAPLRVVNPRLHALLDFGLEVSLRDAVAPAYGSRRLGDYFAALAREDSVEPAVPGSSRLLDGEA